VIKDPDRVQPREHDHTHDVRQAGEKEAPDRPASDALGAHPPRRSAQTPSANPPAPLTGSTEFAACSAIPIW
jgi:hypothetical protein